DCQKVNRERIFEVFLSITFIELAVIEFMVNELPVAQKTHPIGDMLPPRIFHNLALPSPQSLFKFASIGWGTKLITLYRPASQRRHRLAPGRTPGARASSALGPLRPLPSSPSRVRSPATRSWTSRKRRLRTIPRRS